MAANPKSRELASLGKRVVSQIWSSSSRDPALPAVAFSRSAHFSIYDKNPDDQLPLGVVPDELIQPQSDKYWAPHPQTGVFGPAAEQNAATAGAGSRDGGFFSSPVNGGGESVLEEKAWFRPTSLEDLEKPH
ncbi:Late embryogenesis abundant protein [Vitis vinifera]|uniref:Late embryogenesis abundant protein n=1 Tax=Vitis vinifera TaxID=29760 RepID=A0A438E1W6_VITVI|nr:Late embryogenesis abundant protein [Vitis vinifera]